MQRSSVRVRAVSMMRQTDRPGLTWQDGSNDSILAQMDTRVHRSSVEDPCDVNKHTDEQTRARSKHETTGEMKRTWTTTGKDRPTNDATGRWKPRFALYPQHRQRAEHRFADSCLGLHWGIEEERRKHGSRHRPFRAARRKARRRSPPWFWLRYCCAGDERCSRAHPSPDTIWTCPYWEQPCASMPRNLCPCRLFAALSASLPGSHAPTSSASSISHVRVSPAALSRADGES